VIHARRKEGMSIYLFSLFSSCVAISSPLFGTHVFLSQGNTSQKLQLSSDEAQPQPFVDYLGFSLKWWYTRWPNGTILPPQFSSPKASTRVLPKPIYLFAKSPYKKSVVQGYCVIPRPGDSWPLNRTFGAHVWIANLLYNERASF
jgi:hypothetical protein